MLLIDLTGTSTKWSRFSLTDTKVTGSESTMQAGDPGTETEGCPCISVDWMSFILKDLRLAEVYPHRQAARPTFQVILDPVDHAGVEQSLLIFSPIQNQRVLQTGIARRLAVLRRLARSGSIRILRRSCHE